MSRVFAIADLHFGHKNVLKFSSGARQFASIEEHDDALIENINSTVGKNDVLVIVGDVALSKKHVSTVGRIRTTNRVLVGGNHDQMSVATLAPYFTKILGAMTARNVVITHVPVHPDCLGDRFLGNVHGHLHSSIIQDPRYVCVSVEQTGLRPVRLDEIIDRMQQP